MDNDSNAEYFENTRRQVAMFIEELTKYKWLSLLSTPDIHVDRRSSDGGTSAITLSAFARIPLFVKHDPEAVRKEFAGFACLRTGPDQFARHLVPPLSVDRQEFWVAPHVDGISLHSLAMNQVASHPQKWIINVYNDVLSSMKDLWVSTRVADIAPDIREVYYTSRFSARLPRWIEGFGDRHLHDREIVVNATPRGTYGAFLAAFSQRVTEAIQTLPKACCTVHGDEHANNILVQQVNAYLSSTAWLLVDYVNSTNHGDWVFSVAKMLYWWKFYCVVEQAKKDEDLKRRLDSSWTIKDGQLILAYNRDQLMAAVPPICREFEAAVMRLARESGQAFGEQPRRWKERLRLAQVAAIWGAAANHFPQNDFAVPIMVGEAINILFDTP